MEIRERAEATLFPEGACVTETLQAYYFYFRQDNDLWCVRLPKRSHEAESNRMIQVDRTTLTCDESQPAPAKE